MIKTHPSTESPFIPNGALDDSLLSFPESLEDQLLTFPQALETMQVCQQTTPPDMSLQELDFPTPNTQNDMSLLPLMEETKTAKIGKPFSSAKDAIVHVFNSTYEYDQVHVPFHIACGVVYKQIPLHCHLRTREGRTLLGQANERERLEPMLSGAITACLEMHRRKQANFRRCSNRKAKRLLVMSPETPDSVKVKRARSMSSSTPPRPMKLLRTDTIVN